MKDVVDPELMVNIVDLGLIYGVQIDEEGTVTLDMTLTSPTCPLTDRIEYDTKYVLDSLANAVVINWVWMPPWSLEMITEDGREQLRAIGFSV
ncbi:MAG: metal-sulfur cluster biosynthetic enzyme [Actinomycetales bacterium]|nr:MAG: metal-sulfur cluster biosynthetic enzyme [Actinomycetales bacterium]